MRLRMKLAAVTAAGAASVALAAGVPALASGHASAGTSVTGPEVIAGAVHGKKVLVRSPRIPLRWRGLVVTHSVVTLGGGGPHKGSVKTFVTPAGNLTLMVTAKPQSRHSFNPKTCRLSFTQDIVVAAVGGKSSGKFAGASGPGAVQVSLAVNAPRFKSGPNKGKCNPKGKPIAKTAVASFLGSLVLTLK